VIPRLTRGLPLAALLTAAALALLAAPPADGPMTTEDVVRMFAAGRPTEEILSRIEEREPGYDLTPDMLEELRRVDLPEELIEAMLRRLEQKRELEARLAAESREASSPVLRLHLNRDRGGGMSVGIRAAVDPQRAAEWELGNAPEDRRYADLALFVACLTADHVPDQWRLVSPLGRDFHAARRHRMLEFISGVGGEGQLETGGSVRLVAPAEIEIPLETGVAHDLMLGLAVQVGGTYRIVAAGTRDAVLLGPEGTDLDAIVRGGSLRRFKVRFGTEPAVEDLGEDEQDDEIWDTPPDDQPS